MVNNDHTVTPAKLHLRECKNRPSPHPRVTHWDLTTHVSIWQLGKEMNQTAQKKLQKLWVSQGYNII